VPFDLSSATLGAVFGVVATEALKHVVKRHGDRAEGRRKLLRDALSDCAKLTTEATNAAVEYFQETDPASDARKLKGAAVKRHLRDLGTKIQQIDVGLVSNGRHERFPAGLMIKFRQAVTMSMDSANTARLSADDPVITAILRASLNIQTATTTLQYKMT